MTVCAEPSQNSQIDVHPPCQLSLVHAETQSSCQLSIDKPIQSQVNPLSGHSRATEKRHGILFSEKPYDDFVVRLKYKSLEGNSGLYFRVQKVAHAVSVKGFQAEIDATGADVGGLYETLGRAWVVQPKSEDVSRFYKPKDWNEMTVTALGGDVTVKVNGVVTAKLKNDSIPRKGYFGLQLHGGQKMNVMFKDIVIKDLSSTVQPALPEKIHDTSRPLPNIVSPKAKSR